MTWFTLVLMACGGEEEGSDTGPVVEEGWADLAEGLSGAPLDVWAKDVDDLWVVGSDAGQGPLILQLDESGWTPLSSGTTGDLYGVWRESSLVWMVGEGGRIISHTAGTSAFPELVLHEDFTFNTVWAS